MSPDATIQVAAMPGGLAAVAGIGTLADLCAVAYRIGTDTVDCYQLLADQMETHNNPELALLFRDLAAAEVRHAEEIKRMAGDIDVVAHGRRLDAGAAGEGLATADLDAAHYLMTPWHALQMVLAGEKRSLAYFGRIAATAPDPKIREMAEEFVEEEAEHVNLCYRLLGKYRRPSDERWSEDPDPPVSQE